MLIDFSMIPMAKAHSLCQYFAKTAHYMAKFSAILPSVKVMPEEKFWSVKYIVIKWNIFLQ